MQDNWDAAIDEVIDELLAGGAIGSPPVDAIALAERLQIEVAFDWSQQGRGRHKQLAGRASILLRPDERPERLQWAAAHELGEVFACDVFTLAGENDDDIPPQLRETVANRFASRLLLPDAWFPEDAGRFQSDLLQLKKRYRTASHELIAYRLLDLPGHAVVTIFDQGRLTRRRGNADSRPPSLQPIERQCREQVARGNRPVEIADGGVTVQGWPIHEPGWQREILRTVPTWDGDEF